MPLRCDKWCNAFLITHRRCASRAKPASRTQCASRSAFGCSSRTQTLDPVMRFVQTLKVVYYRSFVQSTLAVPESCYPLGAWATFDRGTFLLLPLSAFSGGRNETNQLELRSVGEQLRLLIRTHRPISWIIVKENGLPNGNLFFLWLLFSDLNRGPPD